MRQARSSKIRWFLGVLLGPALCLSLRADDRMLTVHLASGREFTAQVDARTDQMLWLRFSSPGGYILRPIGWNRVIAAEFDGKKLELTALRATCQNVKSAAKAKEKLPPPAAVAVSTSPAPAPVVSSIRIEAWLANWDADVETDGICVMVQPMDENGQLIPVAGTAEVELYAARQRRFQDAPQSNGWMTELMQRWSEQVEPEQIGTSGFLLRLPFAALHPDFSRGVDDWGLVHVRLTVPGSGVFEQSLDGVRLRNWSPVRSGNLQQTGHRFFSTERTGRN